MQTVNVMIVGVGGQGSLLAGKLLGTVASQAGYDVKMSEVHGMSQRGGSVVTHVRFGEKVYSPVICEGDADYIIAFEKLEGARYLPYLKAGGQLIFNTGEIPPMATLTGKVDYPSDILENCRFENVTIRAFDALSLAMSQGFPQAVNTVLMGCFAKISDTVSFDRWIKALETVIPEKYLEANKNAFLLGYESV